MADLHNNKPFTFPKWTKILFPLLGAIPIVFGSYLAAMVPFVGSPVTKDVNYAPEQPVPYSHALHVGQLGIDCRVCHTTVDQAGFAAIPPTQTCMNCHTAIWPESPKLEKVRESYKTGKPIEWVKVHDLPDYAYFNHSAHVTRGVSCIECHGRIDKMEVVTQVHELSMGWCLDCHRDPDPRLRDPKDVTNMRLYQGDDPNPETRNKASDSVWMRENGKKIREKYGLHPNSDCSTCHR